MVDRFLIREFNVDDAEVDLAFDISSLEPSEFEVPDELERIYGSVGHAFDVNQIIEGTVIRVDGDEVLVDIGYKSEGVVTLDEWERDDPLPQAGDKISVLLEEVEDDFGLIMLSKRRPTAFANGNGSSRITPKGTSSKGRSFAKSKAACWSTSGSTYSCPPAKSTFAGRKTSAPTSVARSSA